MSFSSHVQHRWYASKWGVWWLWPLMWLFKIVTSIRRRHYLIKNQLMWRPPVPVVVIGNISVGGTGKTPLTLALLETLKSRGYKPGIVSRGYGGESDTYPIEVLATSEASVVGDEPLMLKIQSGCPVVVAPSRVQAVKYLLQAHECDLILCDDGLQHYALPRDLEICVIDAERGLGCKKLLPVGPLRESVSRLKHVDFVVSNQAVSVNSDLRDAFKDKIFEGVGPGFPIPEIGYMHFAITGLYPVIKTTTEAQFMGKDLTEFEGKKVHAIAGIGHPERFFSMLEQAGIHVVRHAFPDHHKFEVSDLEFEEKLPILMTDKDAVKCQDLAQTHFWRVSIQAILDDDFVSKVMDKIDNLRQDHKK